MTATPDEAFDDKTPATGDPVQVGQDNKLPKVDYDAAFKAFLTGVASSRGPNVPPLKIQP